MLGITRRGEKRRGNRRHCEDNFMSLHNSMVAVRRARRGTGRKRWSYRAASMQGINAVGLVGWQERWQSMRDRSSGLPGTSHHHELASPPAPEAPEFLQHTTQLWVRALCSSFFSHVFSLQASFRGHGTGK